ncbi:MAG: hypothetical protein JW744_03935, partial [Candidatus Diapherotrites archaeon]|nr:hypothetical protein [Candidatus Diapherotrites archaeon]
NFVLAPTGLNRKDDVKTAMAAEFSIEEIIQAAVSIIPTNEYGDYQVSDSIFVSGRNMNPAEFLLLLAKANKALYEGNSADTKIDFVGSKIITPLGNSKSVMVCYSGWCPYQSWTFKPAKFIG